MVCSGCGKQKPFTYEELTCECGSTFLVDYDLEYVRKTLTQQSIVNRATTMWRYRELLPVQSPQSIVSLGEGWTPLTPIDVSRIPLSIRKLWMKREELNPTGSFKSRGLSVAVSLLKERGIRRAAIASNGNAGTALAAYAGCAGIDSIVFVPEDCPPLIIRECQRYGAHTFRVKGLIQHAGQWVESYKHIFDWTSVSTLREPGRVEGKKTLGFELAEQLGWRLPTVIIYPTGGGSGIIGMWKAFKELRELGFIQGPMPRFVSVQEIGCAPLVRALGKQVDSAEAASPTGMRVPHPPDIVLLLRILKETEGTAVAVSRGEIEEARRMLGNRGISASPEGAATWAGLLRLNEEGWFGQDDQVVLFNTAHALPYETLAGTSNIPLLTNLHDLINTLRK
nr:threonine synthase [Cohnella sp. YIM B05605]